MSIADFGIAAVPVITVIVFLIVEAVKATPLDNKWLPVIAGACGGILGIVATYVMPDFPGGDPLTAVAIGIVSGLAATGAHQVYKQLFDNSDMDMGDEEEHPPDEEYQGTHSQPEEEEE